MNENDKAFLKNVVKTLGQLSSVGISMAVAIAIGVFIGLNLDRWFGTGHLFFYIFLLIGIAAGFRNVFILARREMKRDDNGNDSSGNP
jgi:F0F1-type ATP synthase assembly protein I